MKKLLIITILFITISDISAQNDSLKAIFRDANEAYKQGNYEVAVNNYEKILKNNYESADLYYNLGNAYFKQNNIAKSVLNYNKALKLSPKDGDILNNLDYVNDYYLKDEFAAVPEFILTRIFKAIVRIFNSNTWALISINTFLLGLVVFLVYLFSKIISVRKFSFFSSIFLILFSVITFAFSAKAKQSVTEHKSAVIMKISTIKSSPDVGGTDLYILNPGIKVDIKSASNDWYEVRLPNGKIGWILNNDIEKI